MPIDPELLAILVCPENHQPVRPAEEELLARLNERVAAGEVRTRAGQAVESPVREALVREDGKCLYVVEDGIPNMLIEERIDLTS